MTALRSGAATDVGLVRANNQDDYLVADSLFAVADGMGGHAGGEVASLTAVEALQASFERDRSAGGLVDAVREANRAVWERARERPDLRGMGTTITAVALVDEDGEEVLAIANVGDSRAYLLRQGEGLEQLTEDHSVPKELERAGRLSAEEAAIHPQRNVLTRALGIDADVEVDDFQVTPYRGDRLVLATDGLFNEVPDDDIASVLRRVPDPEAAAHELVRMAREGGGNDNITVVVVDVVDDDDRAGRASAAVGPSRSAAGGRGRGSVAPAGAAGAGAGAHARGPAAGAAAGEAAAGAGTSAARGAGEGARSGGRASAQRDAGERTRASGAATGTAARQPPPSPPPPSPSRPGTVTVAAPERRLTLRGVVFVLAVVLVLGAAGVAVGVFARGSYHVGVQDQEVVIFKGRPGGLLWFRPTVAERTGLSVDEIRPHRADAVRSGKEEPSLAAARRYVRNVREEAETTPATTVTTVYGEPPPTTATEPAPPPAPAP